MTHFRPAALTGALGLVLALAACGPSGSGSTAGSSSAPTAASSAAAATTTPSANATTTVDVRDFQLQPATVSVTGSVLSIAVMNAGPTVHNVTVRDATGTVLFGTKDLREGESETVTHAIAPGSYVLFCSLPGHESLGIKGTLTVTAP